MWQERAAVQDPRSSEFVEGFHNLDINSGHQGEDFHDLTTTSSHQEEGYTVRGYPVEDNRDFHAASLTAQGKGDSMSSVDDRNND